MSLIELQTASAGNLNIERAQAPAGPSVPGQLVAQSLPRACYSSITYLFGLSQSTQNVMQCVYVDVNVT